MNWTTAASIFLLASGSAGVAQNAFFAMDTGTKDAQHQTAEAQVALIKEIGFAGIGPSYSSPAALQEMLAALDRHQLKLCAEYVGLDLDAASPVSPQIRDAISQLKGRDAFLWLFVTCKSLKPSDPAGDARAVAALRAVADLAEPAGVRVALYPHAGFWVERVDDGVRVARQVDRKSVGVTFNLCHWLKVDGQELDARLEAAMPYLFVVTINGADADGKNWGQLIQPLDAGTFEVRRVLSKLKALGYAGPIGLQHFGIRGDARQNLQRSMAGWQKLQGVDLTPAGQALAAWQAAKGWEEVGEVTLDPLDPKRFKTGPGRGVIVSSGKADYLLTRELYGDVELHVEFVVPSRSNSGLYFMGSYEVQILDSFGVATPEYPGNACGGIYPEWVNNANVRGHNPRLNVSKAPGEWQTLDVIFRALRFDAAGRKIANARFEKVIHNGQLVQENVEVLGTTRSGLPEKYPGPLRLQGDHGPVAYRNIRIHALPQEK